jgi:hypothetical protein
MSMLNCESSNSFTPYKFVYPALQKVTAMSVYFRRARFNVSRCLDVGVSRRQPNTNNELRSYWKWSQDNCVLVVFEARLISSNKIRSCWQKATEIAAFRKQRKIVSCNIVHVNQVIRTQTKLIKPIVNIPYRRLNPRKKLFAGQGASDPAPTWCITFFVLM